MGDETAVVTVAAVPEWGKGLDASRCVLVAEAATGEVVPELGSALVAGGEDNGPVLVEKAMVTSLCLQDVRESGEIGLDLVVPCWFSDPESVAEADLVVEARAPGGDLMNAVVGSGATGDAEMAGDARKKVRAGGVEHLRLLTEIGDRLQQALPGLAAGQAESVDVVLPGLQPAALRECSCGNDSVGLAQAAEVGLLRLLRERGDGAGKTPGQPVISWFAHPALWREAFSLL
ncbi:hypothetical protein [Streptomyces sp. NPDC127033]|uniref:hypothetical protein n=1 Tax=Streptomyces sp. NPDC127033 TaxID=3347110 RepID=UPI003669FAA9